MRFARTPIESRVLLFAASLLVPRSLREEWRREWDGEVWWWVMSQPDGGHSARERLALARHCVGAIHDGWHLWLDREDRLEAVRRIAHGPHAYMVAAMSAIALIGVLSGGFEVTRHSLVALSGPQNTGAAMLHQTGPFLGQSLGVPPLKVEHWDRHSTTIDGAATYSEYRSVAGLPEESVAGMSVGAKFFSLLDVKPQLGRLFRDGDLPACAACVVVGHEYWRLQLKANPKIIGRTLSIGGRPMQILGVLPKNFWFPGERAAVWTLVNRETPGKLTGAICRMKPATSAAAVKRELRMLARQIAPTESGTWVSVHPLNAVGRGPILTAGPIFIGFFAISLWCSLRIVLRGERRAAAFLLLKTVLLLLVIFLAGLESGAATSAPSVTVFVLTTAGLLAVRWAWNDQEKRCRHCLGRLVLPVSIGEGSRALLEPGGIEMACPGGHGVLFTAHGDSTAPRERWHTLDATWGELFSPVAKT